MRHIVYSVRYSVALLNSSLLTITLNYSIITTLAQGHNIPSPFYDIVKDFDCIYTGCNRRNVRDFGRVFLRSKYTDISQNTYIQSWTVTEIMAIEMCGLLGCRRTVRLSWCHTCPMRLTGTRHDNAVTLASALQSAAACGKVLGSLRTTMTRVRVFL